MKLLCTPDEIVEINTIIKEAGLPTERFWEAIAVGDFSIECSMMGQVEDYIINPEIW